MYEITSYRGISGSSFYMCQDAHIPSVTKIMLEYLSALDIHAPKNKHLTGKVFPMYGEVEILQYLRENVLITGRSECIIELYDFQVCSVHALLKSADIDMDDENSMKLIAEHSDYGDMGDIVKGYFCSIGRRIKKHLVSDSVVFAKLEPCDSTFDEFLKQINNNSLMVEIFKALFFAIIHTRWVMGEVLPGLHHGDMHTGNVFLVHDKLFSFNAANIIYNVFEGPNGWYAVPYYGITPKAADFGYSRAPSLGIDPFIKIPTTALYAEVPDMNIFMYWISESCKSPIVQNILKVLDPKQTYKTIDYGDFDATDLETENDDIAKLLDAEPFKEFYIGPRDSDLKKFAQTHQIRFIAAK